MCVRESGNVWEEGGGCESLCDCVMSTYIFVVSGPLCDLL